MTKFIYFMNVEFSFFSQHKYRFVQRFGAICAFLFPRCFFKDDLMWSALFFSHCICEKMIWCDLRLLFSRWQRFLLFPLALLFHSRAPLSFVFIWKEFWNIFNMSVLNTNTNTSANTYANTNSNTICTCPSTGTASVLSSLFLFSSSFNFLSSLRSQNLCWEFLRQIIYVHALSLPPPQINNELIIDNLKPDN